MESENSESQKSARLAIMELSNMLSIPMALNAVARLNVADAMWQGGANTPLSASEILSRILPSGAGDAENLQRLLRMLTSYGVFSEHIDKEGRLRKYCLTEIGKTLVPDADGLSWASYVLQQHQDALMQAWPLLHETVLDPTTAPFVKVNGEAPYHYYLKRPETTALMLKASAGTSVSFMKAFLSSYDGFEGVQKVVDVGGSGGDCLKTILQKYPKISQAINFDLPQVVANAPHIAGVTHVGGDILNSVPSADAIFMKFVLLTFTDDECKKIMENCYKALPKGGKMILCEPVLPKDTDDSRRTRALLEGDIFVMTIYNTKGKHRTEAEFKQLGQLVGFSIFQAYYIDHYLTVLEFLK
ncbi:O-methyltransferase family protein [Euphorbia peplus]|nr:O-methyltransferase family protein [Euphorbia peplus]